MKVLFTKILHKAIGWNSDAHIALEWKDGDRFLYGNGKRFENDHNHFFWKYHPVHGDMRYLTSYTNLGGLENFISDSIVTGEINQLIEFETAREAMQWVLDSEYDGD